MTPEHRRFVLTDADPEQGCAICQRSALFVFEGVPLCDICLPAEAATDFELAVRGAAS